MSNYLKLIKDKEGEGGSKTKDDEEECRARAMRRMQKMEEQEEQEGEDGECGKQWR